MSVGVLGSPQIHGAELATIDYANNGTAYATDPATGQLLAAPVPIDGAGYDNIVWDSAGFAGAGIVAPIDRANAPDLYAGDGIMTVPPGLAGVYVATAKLYIGGPFGISSFARWTLDLLVNGVALDWDITALGDGSGSAIGPNSQGGTSVPIPTMTPGLGFVQRVLALNAGDTVQAALSSLYLNDPANDVVYAGSLSLVRLGSLS